MFCPHPMLARNKIGTQAVLQTPFRHASCWLLRRCGTSRAVTRALVVRRRSLGLDAQLWRLVLHL